MVPEAERVSVCGRGSVPTPTHAFHKNTWTLEHAIPLPLPHGPQHRGSGSADTTIRIWDLVTGTSLHTLPGHSDQVDSVAFSPDGTRLASGSDDRTVRLWDASTGAPVGSPLKVGGVVNSVAFSVDGSKIAAACNDYEQKSCCREFHSKNVWQCYQIVATLY